MILIKMAMSIFGITQYLHRLGWRSPGSLIGILLLIWLIQMME